MKKSAHERNVELEHTFEDAWKIVCGRNIRLKTNVGTPFLVKAKMVKRRGGSSSLEEVLVFLKNYGDGKLKECSRCYIEDWGCYFNHLERQGQRVGMYCKAVDF